MCDCQIDLDFFTNQGVLWVVSKLKIVRMLPSDITTLAFLLGRSALTTDVKSNCFQIHLQISAQIFSKG